MIEFLLPWVGFLILLPVLVYWLLPVAKAPGSAALRVPFYHAINHLAEVRQQQSSWKSLNSVLLLLVYILLLLASARPQWLGEPILLPVSGRDLMLAVDLSGSMETPDLHIKNQAVDRLTVVKAVLGEFIERRKGDRLGLVLFGEQAYLQTPLTFDRKTVKTMLNESLIGLAGQKTAIGDAIGLAVKRLRERPEENRVLILLTDGANNAGAILPQKAAELAQQAGVRIYTIGVGADEMLQAGLFGAQRVNPSRDLDEKTLKQVAKITGGAYFRARDMQGLVQIYQTLDELEPVEVEQETFRPMTPLYPWPLAMALVLALLLGIRVKQ
ncbi:vWA domain-containing protein [Candidatus Venteria ishoeyi]|uniref:von Willebrand factor type A domain protein n=1 Tax=Candidatus Venteria ishoeyi TaxID=1899563 RepID=A0A1H6FCS9_9GAMM|nr:VWA domain-containing protein [Candidatus Venteria ishoeyi]MDM8545099.1 VWA domain-containing protein [Candidatus Venteria ishoeyi]SEH07878.1 von Willebrand factor type A domain protein [Candidatus Venteria ishoeyi]